MSDNRVRNPGGRPKGIPNRVNGHARRAIAEFVEKNVPRFSGWLDRVANGIPVKTKAGEEVLDANGCTVWLVKPDPLGALKIVGDLTEYHLPKLSRSDVSVTGVVASLDLGDLKPEDVAKLSLADLKTLALERMMNNAGNVIDVEATVVDPLPIWLEPLK